MTKNEQREINRKLLKAAEEGNVRDVKSLLAAGAQVDAKDRENQDMQPLHYAARQGHLRVVKVLLESGAKVDDPDGDGSQPLYYAVVNDHLGILKLLLANGADPMAEDKGGGTPFNIAVVWGKPELISFMEAWMEPKAAEKRQRAENDAAIRAILARQRRLGSLRPKSPGL